MFIVPDDSHCDTAALETTILAECEKHLINYAIPKEMEFREELPKTKVGKIDYVELERQEQARRETAAPPAQA